MAERADAAFKMAETPRKNAHMPRVRSKRDGARIFSTFNQNNFFNRSLQNEVDLTSVT